MREQFLIHSGEALKLIQFARKQKDGLHLLIDGEHTYLVIPNIFELHGNCYLNELARIRACQYDSSELLSQPSSEHTSIISQATTNCQDGFETQVLF